MRAFIIVALVATSAVAGYVLWIQSRQADEGERTVVAAATGVAPQEQLPSEDLPAEPKTGGGAAVEVAPVQSIATAEPEQPATEETRAEVASEAQPVVTVTTSEQPVATPTQAPAVAPAPAQQAAGLIVAAVEPAEPPAVAVEPEVSSVAPAAGGQTAALAVTVDETTGVAEPAPEREKATESVTAALPSATPEPEATAEPEPASIPETVAEPPTFDIVRVSPEGMAIIAGRAEPGADITVREGETVVAVTKADERGEWVVLPEKPLEPGTRQLGLSERTAAGETIESESVVVLAIPERDEETRAAQGDEALVVLLPRGSGGESRVMQEPDAGVGIKGPENLSLDTIDYDDEGNVVLGGRGTEGSEIVVYLDDQFIGRAEVGDKSDWRVTPEEALPLGTHRLRIDQIDEAGKVVARVETLFARASLRLPGAGESVVVVQPGNSLWRIARRVYGGGIKYVVIYEANNDQIRDPDLIYPGQIFLLPELNQEG
ncbi:MAG: LysM peptidoglycan-binding domain-containing protein [Alphaproteobacteria bacterium]